jgi:hypothetical protein
MREIKLETSSRPEMIDVRDFTGRVWQKAHLGKCEGSFQNVFAIWGVS